VLLGSGGEKKVLWKGLPGDHGGKGTVKVLWYFEKAPPTGGGKEIEGKENRGRNVTSLA